MLFFVSCAQEPDVVPSGFSSNSEYNPSIDELKITNIPVFNINVDNNEEVTEKEYKWTCSIDVIDPAGLNNIFLDNVKIKCRGNSSFTDPGKKSYTIKLDSKQKVLGLAKNKNWVFIANHFDKSLLRNYFTTQIGNNIYNKLGWTPSFKSVHLVINNIYRGVYLFGESIKINDKRVNVQDISDFGTSKFIDTNGDGNIDLYDGGFIVEINKRLDENFNFISKQGICFSLKEPDEVPSYVEQHIQKIIQTAEDSIYSHNYKDPESGYAKYFDVDSMIDWYLINEFAKNTDSAFFSSVFMYYNPVDSKIHFGPIWDFDLGYGNDYECPDGLEINDPNGFYIGLTASWVNRLLTDETFVYKLKNRWLETKDSLLSYINNLDTLGNDLSDAAVCNYIEWFYSNSDSSTIKVKYLDQVDELKNWMLARYTFMDNILSSL